MNSKEIKKFIRDKEYLFWWIRDDAKEDIEIPFLVEQILNYGTKEDIKRLFDLVGINQVAEIFYRQTHKKRINYYPEVVNFFKLYFKRHVKG